MDNSKLSLPAFLKILTSNNVPVPKAMTVAGKIYKDYNTPTKLAELTDVKLVAAGIDIKEDRKLIVNAIRKAGYIYKGKPPKSKTGETSESSALPSSSTSPTTSVQQAITPPKKRKRGVRERDVNEFLPDGPRDEVESYGSFEFNEILDEDVLCTKSTIVNRAPLMTVWSMLVAERLNFQREEALSIASVYTEMNAISKGISLGRYHKNRERGMEALKEGSQPYVEIMGRRIPMYRSKNGHWRALSNGSPVAPSVAFSYISRSFRQTTSDVVGALKLLADSYTPKELNEKGWSLYAEFRPAVEEWGKKSEVKCETILNLRKAKDQTQTGISLEAPPVRVENTEQIESLDGREPASKKPRTMTLEEYEAALDEDTTFDNIDLCIDAVDL